MRVWSSWSAVVWVLCLSSVSSASPAAPETAEKVIARIDLSKPFHLPSGASFTATQGPLVEHPVFDRKEPGRIHLCVRRHSSDECAPALDDSLSTSADRDDSAGIHYLEAAEIVRPKGSSDPPLLHLQVASMYAVNGSQGHAATLIAYVPSQHRFEKVVEKVVGGNMNQEIRYIAAGPLRGAMINAEPTDDAPFGYWITVNRPTPAYRYRQVLRYRSATHYNDGNTLAVIDSEMPSILRRLGLWHPGDPLPVPKSGCAHPRLVKTELWCS